MQWLSSKGYKKGCILYGSKKNVDCNQPNPYIYHAYYNSNQSDKAAKKDYLLLFVPFKSEPKQKMTDLD